MARYIPPAKPVPQAREVRSETETKTESLQALTKAMNETHEDVRMTDEQLKQKLELKARLERTLKETLGDNVQLTLYGSIVSGFGSSDSDLDMTLNTDRMKTLSLTSVDSQVQLLMSQGGKKYVSEKNVDCEILEKVYRELRRKELNLSELAIIKQTVMPIVKGHDDVTGNTWQISTSNDVGVKNARLLKMYSKVDSRLVPLAMVVKIWAGCHDVNDARERMPNNYCWTILVIYYLMVVCSPPVLPCLHKMFAGPVSDITSSDNTEDEVEIPNFTSKNSQNLGQLLAGFFAYYADEIGCQQVFSIREGRRLNPRTLRSRRPTRQWECLLLVEDPTSLNNIPRSLVVGANFPKLIAELKAANETLQSGGTLNEILKRR